MVNRQKTERSDDIPSSLRSMILPLALAQFVASYAASNMNVAINDIARDLRTDVSGVQTSITLFTLTMAALMIPGSKLSDIYGRKRCFRVGLVIYGVGALIAAAASTLGVLTIGYSFLEGIGSALMIPPIYILTTVLFTELRARARAFGVINAMAGVGSASGPLIGGLITTAISWRASFVVQAILVAIVIYLGRRIADPGVEGPKPSFDLGGAVLSALGLFFIVIGILQADNYGWLRSTADFVIGGNVIIPEGGISPVWLFVGIGAAFLLWFFRHIRSMERADKEPLLPTRLFQNRVSNLGLVTQNLQWLILLGTSFVVSVYFQVIHGYSAIQTGLLLTPATVGLLLSSLNSGRFAKRFAQASLIRAGFLLNILGVVLLFVLAGSSTIVLSTLPGLFVIGFSVGLMLTASVNVVQSSFPEEDQGEISGLSRSVSNLGSSLGTAIAGTVLVSAIDLGGEAYGLALLVLMVFAVIGFIVSMRIPSVKPEVSPADAVDSA